MTSASFSQLSTFANNISSMSEAVPTGIGCVASGYSPVRTPCKVAMVLEKFVVLPLTAPSCQQIVNDMLIYCKAFFHTSAYVGMIDHCSAINADASVEQFGRQVVTEAMHGALNASSTHAINQEQDRT